MTIEEAKDHLKYLIKCSQNIIDSGNSPAPDLLNKDIECYKIALEIIGNYKTGNWIVNEHGNINCSKCGFERSSNNISNYCPECGASMKTLNTKHCDIIENRCAFPYINCTDCEIQSLYKLAKYTKDAQIFE